MKEDMRFLLCIVLLQAILPKVGTSPIRLPEQAQAADAFTMKYLENFSGLTPGVTGGDEMTAAIKIAQRFLGLPETGNLDVETLEKMKQPRCGKWDVEPGSAGKKRRRKRYKAVRKVSNSEDGIEYWYSHGPSVIDMNQAEIEATIAKAAQIWMDASSALNIQPLDSSSSLKKEDFHIFFGPSIHIDSILQLTCGSTFGSNTLGHAYFPSTHTLTGDIHINTAYKWHENHSAYSGSTYYSLLWVMVHEMGHSLGLDHTNVQDNVMLPSYPSSAPPLTAVGSDDRDGIKALYESGPATTTPPPPPTTPGSTTPRPECPHPPRSQCAKNDKDCKDKCENWCIDNNILSSRDCRKTY